MFQITAFKFFFENVLAFWRRVISCKRGCCHVPVVGVDGAGVVWPAGVDGWEASALIGVAKLVRAFIFTVLAGDASFCRYIGRLLH